MNDGASTFPGKLRTKRLIKSSRYCIKVVPRCARSRPSAPRCSKFWNNTRKIIDQTREASDVDGPYEKNLGFRGTRLARDHQLSHAVFPSRPLGPDRGDDALFHLEDFRRVYRFAFCRVARSSGGLADRTRGA